MSVFDPAIFDGAVFDTGGGGGGGGGSITANAVIRRARSGSFTADATFAPRNPQTARVTIQWLYDGDDITDDVEIRTARAESKTNGGVGSATLRVRDKGHTYEPGYFAFGKTLELFLNGDRVWDGYVFVVERSWYFDVDDTTVPFATPRAWTLRAVDRNIHLQRRIIFNQDDPTRPLPDIPHATTDQDALLGLLADWVQKSGTGVDWTSGIETIDAPSEGEDYVLGEVGQALGVIFEDCAKVTGGVYCITPDRVMRYSDDMTVTAPFDLSDDPNNVTSFGYREVEDWLDSNEMANDAMVWGAGKGSDQPVFARHQDSDSITDHGRWQWADLWTGAWKEATVRKRARSYVEGSTTHRRGHKDPLPDVTVTLFKDGLRAGQVVRFIHSSYGVDRVLPIRSLTMTFPTPWNVQYVANLSLIYDTPYGIIDPWWNLPDGGGGGGGGDGGGRTTSDCAVLIDEFDRELDGAWGTSTSGAAWHDTDGGMYGVYNDIGIGSVQGGTDAPQIGFNWLAYSFASIPRLLLFRWRFSGAVDGYTLTDYTISFMAVSDPSTFTTSGPDQNGLYTHSLSETDEYIYTEAVDWHLTRIYISPTGWKGKTWLEGQPEPTAWTKEGGFEGIEVGAADMWIYLDWINSDGDEGNRFYLDYIRDVTNGIDGPCDYTLDAIDDWGRSILRDTTDQEDTYGVWVDWYEWRVISAGPTYAHGEGVTMLAGFALDGQFKEVWLGDVVSDDPGTGNSAPTNPPPSVIYTRRAAFDHFDYVVEYDGSWGDSLTGGTWVAIANRNMMQGVYDGAGVGFPGQATGEGYVYLGSRSFADGDDLVLVWRGKGTMSDALGYEPKLFFCGHFVDVAWASHGADYILDEAWKRTRVQLEGTTFRAKTWYDGDAEPAGWEIEEAHALDAAIAGWSGASSSHISIAMTGQQIGGTSGDPAYPWSEFQFDHLFEVGSQVVYGTWTDTGTLDAQNTAVAWNAQGNVFQTRYPYKQGSLRVWLDGLELQSGVEFIETDPENGLFTISGDQTSTDLTASMQVRYQRLVDSETGTLPPPGGRNSGYTGGRVYRPHLQQQYGWGTYWDGSNCTAASSAMCLDRHTYGALTPWKGYPRNTPPAHRSFSGHFDVEDRGLSMGDMEQSWNVGWGRTLTYMGQISFTLFETMINQGRGAIVAGLYGSLPDRLRFSSTFTGGHAIYVNEQFSDGSFLVYDPLSRKSLVYTRAEMYTYTTRWTGTGLVNVSFSRPTTIEAA